MADHAPCRAPNLNQQQHRGPSLRWGGAAGLAALVDKCAASRPPLLQHLQLHAALASHHHTCLSLPAVDDDGQLLISADSLRLLPARLPYELLAHALQAAVDSCASAQQQQLSGLRLVAVDLQEPAARPLRTCIAAYPCLTRLSLAELNVDVTAAAALGAIAGGVSGGSLQHLALEGTFMCDLAWQAFADGLAAGCQLTSLRCVQQKGGARM